MAGSWPFTVLVAAVLLAAAANADDIIVGDTAGWQNPTGNAMLYSNWAATQNFSVGDVLVFNFVTGSHDVVSVSKAVYDGCNVAGATNIIRTGPARVPLTTPGMQYFVCTISNGNHCNAGQKLAINVTPNDDTPPSTPGTPAGGSSPPPPSSSAASLAASFVSVAAMGFMCLF